jgi:hypothetical protein
MTNDAAIDRSNPQLAKIQIAPAIGALTTSAMLVWVTPSWMSEGKIPLAGDVIAIKYGTGDRLATNAPATPMLPAGVIQIPRPNEIASIIIKVLVIARIEPLLRSDHCKPSVTQKER